jgi:predicted adenine nucleotide alpha hydrolase (AANH) superfamily ATPase
LPENEKVLLHTCCAICSGYPIKHLMDLDYKPIAYFYNPNICPDIEYQKRLEAQKTLCKTLNCELIVEDYTPQEYFHAIKGYENCKEGSERCKKCFELRLLKTVKKAQELRINCFTTSISISPHKNFGIIKEIGYSLSNKFNIKFLDIDFKKQDGFLKTNKIAKELNLYRQDYCGCTKVSKK